MFKLTILGDGGVGKTALVIQLCLNRFVETYDPTIEDSYRKHILLDGHATTLEIMDTAGQEDYASLRDQWIRDGEGFLMVYSITERSSFERAKQLYAQILRVKDGETIGLVLVGNKCDEEDQRQVDRLEGERLAQSWGVPFFETSAKFGINTDYAFLQAARLARNTHDDDSTPSSSRSSFERGEHPRQGSYSSAQSAYSSATSNIMADGLPEPAPGLAAASPRLGPGAAKPPLLSKRSTDTHQSTRSADSWITSRSSHEAAQRYAQPGGRLATSDASVARAGSFADSDGGDTIVARPRAKKKKAKCAIM